MTNGIEITNAFGRVNTSYSGADAVATITPIGGKPRVFGEIQTISYSVYRPTKPVYALGQMNPKGVVRGPRTIAGTIIFTVFDRHVLRSVIDTLNHNGKGNYGLSASELDEMKRNMKSDELPPFDVNVTFMNEYGHDSTLNIYGLHILSEGQTMSIEDVYTENTMQYIAMDIDLMESNGLDIDRR